MNNTSRIFTVFLIVFGILFHISINSDLSDSLFEQFSIILASIALFVSFIFFPFYKKRDNGTAEGQSDQKVEGYVNYGLIGWIVCSLIAEIFFTLQPPSTGWLALPGWLIGIFIAPILGLIGLIIGLAIKSFKKL